MSAERECFKLDPERLAEAVSRYIDWEAFAYWARPGLEHKEFLVSEVVHELDARCPGFVEFNAKPRAADRQPPNDWDLLMLWIGEISFTTRKRRDGMTRFSSPRGSILAALIPILAVVERVPKVRIGASKQNLSVR